MLVLFLIVANIDTYKFGLFMYCFLFLFSHCMYIGNLSQIYEWPILFFCLYFIAVMSFEISIWCIIFFILLWNAIKWVNVFRFFIYVVCSLCKLEAAAVNLVGGEKPADVYSEIASR